MAKKKRTRQDPVLGDLTHVVADLWQRDVDVRFLGQDWRVPLYVNISEEDREPEPQQRSAYATFARGTADIIRTAEAAILEYCRTTPGIDGVTSLRHVAERVQLEAVTFPYAHPTPTFGFLCKCDWDEEHGLAVKLVDGEQAEVGAQDILL
jgi:hypothetical protein